jgi:hypothetical protein
MGQWLVIQDWLRLARREKAYLGLMPDLARGNRQNLKEGAAPDGQLTVIRVRSWQTAGGVEIEDDAVFAFEAH